MEIARILKDVPTEYSIKFIHFTGEEQGLLGSKNFVTNVVNSTTPKTVSYTHLDVYKRQSLFQSTQALHLP